MKKIRIKTLLTKKKSDFLLNKQYHKLPFTQKCKNKTKQINSAKLKKGFFFFCCLPNNTISTSTDRTNRRDILPRNLKEVTIDIVLQIPSTMSWYSSDVILS